MDVWEENGNPLRKWGVSIPNFQDLWDEIMRKTSLESQELCALIFRNIWLRKNSFIFQNVFSNPKQVVDLAIYLLSSFQQASQQERKKLQKKQESQRTNNKPWRKQEENQAKFNWDAAVSAPLQTTSLGGLIRDSNGMSLCLSAVNSTTLLHLLWMKPWHLERPFCCVWNFIS